ICPTLHACVKWNRCQGCLNSIHSRTVTLYPIYINKKARFKHGRRVPKKFSIENPTIREMKDVLENMGYKVTLENEKCHPSDVDKDNPSGRIKVEIISQNNSKVSKNDLLRLLCENLPKLKSRALNNINNVGRNPVKSKKGKR
ncbi:hypothetical protein MXB_1552, partial [Myxobolus squamalis]